MTEAAIAIVALLAGLLAGWWLAGRPVAALKAERDEARREADERRTKLAEAAVEIKSLQTERAERDAGHARQLEELNTRFEALAGRVLEQAQSQLITRAEQRFAEAETKNQANLKAVLAPVAETLAKYETRLGEVEKVRAESYGALTQALEQVTQGQARVSDEAARLVTALRSSGKTSGSWGEQQLANTLEMAGLRAGVDFTLQTHTATESGGKRPDAIINLPGGRQLIVDSKCSLNDYLAALEAGNDADRLAAMKRHAAAVRLHARGLSEKAYWTEFGAAADFVIMFIPGENFLSAAMEHDLALLSWAFEQRILLAGPINLLAIAKTVALNWRQDKLADEAREIGRLGADIYSAIAVMAEHLVKMRRNLGETVSNYNDFVGSLERNVLPKARRFADMGVEQGKKPVPVLASVDAQARTEQAPELLAPPQAALPPAVE
ncbi:DNA recombination protein RmuC [Sandarakinorhabdus oryzae]|uniref:DNA recombination protein RmuC n=1 Tax=Sandarakinorhabdus oryzae TaxID=2675220 RepID=UPI0018CC4B78|nr:DNA recombination protein RmuC [Sandarakinorhabdus oryzae]